LENNKDIAEAVRLSQESYNYLHKDIKNRLEIK